MFHIVDEMLCYNIYFDAYECLACMDICALHMCLLHLKARRKHHIP